MRVLPDGLQAHLDTGATTLCHCWRVTRADGVRLGFTDHDEALDFDGTRFEAASGFEGTEAVSALGLRVGSAEVAGAFSSDRITRAELEGGVYDGARVEVWLVNWSDLAQRLVVSVGTVGEVRSSDGAFAAELRGPAHAMQKKGGRVFSHMCGARLGDAACGVSLDGAAFSGIGAVTMLEGERVIVASGLDGFAQDWFRHGLLRWTGGDNAGRAHEVKAHRRRGQATVIELWQRPARAIAPGDAFRVTAGCDKRFETCGPKFANAVNFRGFPHMPGNDFAMTYPVSGEANDGAPTR